MDGKIPTRLRTRDKEPTWCALLRQGTLRRTISSMLVFALILITVQPAFALPQGEHVWYHDDLAPIFDWGSPGELTIQQFGDRLGIDWESFSIEEGEIVTFLQPGDTSVVVNRVIGHNPSEIFGQLHADGQVFLLNPHGVLFAESAHVDVGSLVASTLWMDDDRIVDPWSIDPYTFYKKDEAAGAVENFGTIAAKPWGSVFLIGPVVRNAGEITTSRGTIALAAGDKVSLTSIMSTGPDLVIEKAALDALVENQQGAKLEGELVILSAQAEETVRRSVINQDGIVHAYAIQRDDTGAGLGGTIILSGGDTGTVHVGGQLDTEAASGQIHISGDEIVLTTDSNDPVTIHTEEIMIEANDQIAIDAPVQFQGSYWTEAVLDAPNVTINDTMTRSSTLDLSLEITNSSDQASTIISTTDGELDVSNLNIYGTRGSIDLRGPVKTSAMGDLGLYFTEELSQLIIRNAANRIGGIAFGSSGSPLSVIGTGDRVDIRTGDRPLLISGELVADGNVTIWNEGADLTLFGTGTSLQVHGLLTLAATDGGVFRNLVGPGALGGDGRARIYSTQDAAGFDDGGLVDEAGFIESRGVSYGEDPLAYAEGSPNAIYFLDPNGAPVLIIELVPTELVYGDLSSDYTFEVKYYLFTDPEVEHDPDLGADDHLRFLVLDDEGKEIGTNEWRRLSVGQYGLDARGTFQNYRLQYNPSTLTIKKRDLTIIVGDDERYYGENRNLTDVDVTYDGLTPWDTTAMESMNHVLTTDATIASDVGQYVIALGVMDEDYKAVLENYNVTAVEGTLTIIPRPLTIDIGDLTRVYGDDNDLSLVTLTPQTSGGQSGLTLGHTLADLGLGNPANFLYTDAKAQPASLVGTYGIFANADAMQKDMTSTANNYQITMNPGVFEILRRPVTITAHDLTRYYLDPNDFTYTISDLGYGHEPTLWFSPLPHEWNLDTGQYDIQPIVALEDRNQYDFTLETGTLTVLPRPIEIDVHEVTRQYGRDVEHWLNRSTITGIPEELSHYRPTLTYNTGSVTVRSNVGTYEGVVTATTENPNFQVTRVSPGTLHITPAPVWIDALSLEKTYGDSVSLTYGHRGIMEWDDPDQVIYGVELYSDGVAETADAGLYSINVTAGDVYEGNYYLAGYGDARLIVSRRLLYPWLGDIEYHAGEIKPDHIIRFDNKASFHSDEDLIKEGGYILASRASNLICPGQPRCGAADETGPWKFGARPGGLLARNYELVYDDPDQYGYEIVLPPLSLDEIIDLVITNPRPSDVSHPPVSPPSEPEESPSPVRFPDHGEEIMIIRRDDVEFKYEMIGDYVIVQEDGVYIPTVYGPQGDEIPYHIPTIESLDEIPDECITWIGGTMHVDGNCLAWEEFPYTAGVPHESREILGQALGKWMQEMVLPDPELLHLPEEEQEAYLRQRMNLTAGNFRELWDRLVAGDEELMAEVFPYLVAEFHAILEKDEKDLTPGELAYVQHMAKVIQQERKESAQRALTAYDNWRQGVEEDMEERGPNLITVFHPGATPPDYLIQMAKHGFGPQDEETGERLATMLQVIGGVGGTSLAALGITSGIPGALTGLGQAIFPFAARAGTLIAQTVSAGAAIIGTVVSMAVILGFGIETLVRQERVRIEIQNALERAEHEPTFSELKEMMSSDDGQVELMLYQATAFAKYGPGGVMEKQAKGEAPPIIIY